MATFPATHGIDDGSFPIVRSQPIRQTYGRALSAFIHNGAYFLEQIDVFADAWSGAGRAPV